MDSELKLKILRLMITARALEERTIMMAKSAEGFFWIGGPGEEAFNVCLGLLSRPGSTLDDDFYHLHYRNSGLMLALGMDPAWAIRQMAVRATDPFSGGRNFCSHYAYRPWNVMPVTSAIQVQCSIAPGTARAQKRHGGTGITICISGDAGTAEGDFHVGLNWASQPGWELPLLFAVTNNRWGISTAYSEVQGHGNIADKAKGYGMKSAIVDGNDVEATYRTLQDVMQYVRYERRPFLLEAMVSRLHGHSSSSGGNRVPEGAEDDCLVRWTESLTAQRLVSGDQVQQWLADERARMGDIVRRVKDEPHPTAESIYQHIWAETSAKSSGRA